MSKTPPLLPAETLARVLRISRTDGILVLAVAAAFAMLSALAKDLPGAMVGLLVASAGAAELHGSGLLRAGEIRGISWLVGSQVHLITVVFFYVIWRLTFFDPAPLRVMITPDLEQALRDLGYTFDEFARMANRLSCALFASLTLLYQGGMALYYYRRRGLVEAALAE
ncbi:MAG: hypothetical protein HZA31_13510 [Opitutae bacterium]|nr:hypothetical protein [Opitutae bacterium]